MSIAPLGAIIRRRRTDRNLSQDQLARLAHVSRRHLSLIENETANVSLEVLSRIANALELTEVYVGSLSIRATPPDLETLVFAGDAVDGAKRAVLELMQAARRLDQAQKKIDDLIQRYAAVAGVHERIAGSARHLESAGSAAVADTLDEIAVSDRLPPRLSRPEPAEAPKGAARRRTR